MTHVPYKGAGPAVAALLGQQFTFMIDNLPSSMPYIQSGKLRALAVTTEQPSPSVPGLPPIASAVPGFAAMPWLGLVAPAGTPAPIVDMIYRNVAQILQEPQVKARFVTLGLDAIGNDPQTFAHFIAKDIKTWNQVAREGNIRVD